MEMPIPSDSLPHPILVTPTRIPPEAAAAPLWWSCRRGVVHLACCTHARRIAIRNLCWGRALNDALTGPEWDPAAMIDMPPARACRVCQREEVR